MVVGVVLEVVVHGGGGVGGALGGMGCQMLSVPLSQWAWSLCPCRFY